MTDRAEPAVGSGQAADPARRQAATPSSPSLSTPARGDQDDVVLVDAKNFRDLGLDPNALRSQKVADLDPARVEFLRVEAFGRTFDLSRTADRLGAAPADARGGRPAAVRRLLNGLGEAKTSEFLDPSKVDPAGDRPAPDDDQGLAGRPERPRPAIGLDAPPKAEPRRRPRGRQPRPAPQDDLRPTRGRPDPPCPPRDLRSSPPPEPLAFRDRTVLTLEPRPGRSG